MHLAYSSNAYLNFSIDETIARIARLGYAGLELLADVPHAWPAGLLEEQKHAIRRMPGEEPAGDLQRQRLLRRHAEPFQLAYFKSLLMLL